MLYFPEGILNIVKQGQSFPFLQDVEVRPVDTSDFALQYDSGLLRPFLEGLYISYSGSVAPMF